MALQDSGEIKFSDIATEYGVSLSNVSLATLSENIGLEPNHAISEFYGRTATPTLGTLTDTINLSVSPEDSVYFGGYHFLSDRSTSSNSYYSDDDGVTWTSSGSVFNSARFTVAGDYLISIGYSFDARYKFGSEPNPTPYTTYYSGLNLYRTLIDQNLGSDRSNAIYYNGFIYSIKGSSVRKWNATNFSFSYGAALSISPIINSPLAVGNDGRMITFGINGTQPSFYVSDNEFANTTIIPLPSVANYPYTTASSSTSWFNGSKIVTNGNGTWIFTAPLFLNDYTLYAYSTDNGDSWTATQDYYDIVGVMSYTPGGSNTPSGNYGDVENAYFVNNSFYLAFADGRLSGSDNGGAIFSTDGINMTSETNIGGGARALSFNGSTVCVAGDNKILRFT